MSVLIFYLFAAVAIACSVVMITSRKPVVSALSLIAVMFCLAGVFALLDAHLIAALQVLVYAGAIMVLFLFVIMLLNITEKTGGSAKHKPAAQIAAAAVFAAVFTPLAALTYNAASAPAAKGTAEGFGTTAGVGELLYTVFLLPFEIASILLLVAIVGAVILTKTKLR